jgi:hypothetical protein
MAGEARAQAKPEAAQTKIEAEQQKPETVQPKAEAADTTSGDPAQAKTEEGKLTTVQGGKALGMSILGNQEAPTSLVIVPWKSSELGGTLGISPMLDDSRMPVDKEVFMRMLGYYEIRSGTAHPAATTPVTTNAAQPSAAAQRRK